MNPLTQIRNTQKATRRERDLGLSANASWHARYKHSAYVYVGGLNYNLTEGDLLAVFAQYGEVVDVNLIRDKKTGKSRGFAFLAYEDQRSTVLVVDDLSGVCIGGRTIRVEHVDDYKRKIEDIDGDDGANDSCDAKLHRTHDMSSVVHPDNASPTTQQSRKLKRKPSEEDSKQEKNVFDDLAAHLKKKQR